MSLEIIFGESRNRAAAIQLADALRSKVSNGTMYLGYPVLATADERVDVDGLLVSPDHGLVAFLIANSQPEFAEDWQQFVDAQDRLYAVLESDLRRHEGLRSGRKLAVDINTVTVFAAPVTDPPFETDGKYCDVAELPEWIMTLPGINSATSRALQAALQHVTTIKPAKKRASARDANSRGSSMKTIERGIANLDRWQKAAAIETPEGPQRIRGLAGSGKTVVLALKAAYLHAKNPDWRIAITFHSRSLYQQIDDLVTRFTFEHTNDRPDVERLQIMHSWGSASRPGVYSEMALALGVTPRDYGYARGTYGMEDAFQGICRELLLVAQATNPEPIFDAVLIDEAQDLPPEFFQLVYLLTKSPKRIIWGFDELQKLSEAAMPDTDELFGVGASGENLVSLVTQTNEARRDIVLPVCYRNTPWALATAHALGIGVYRNEGLIQHFDNVDLWKDIGYNVVRGRLEPGKRVTLERSKDSYPEYFPTLLSSDEAVQLRSFDDEIAQDEWVAQQIRSNITIEELEHDDILIVLPDTYRAKTRGGRLMSVLRRYGIPCHLAGVGTSRDEIFVRGSVALAHIYRAKGNEAPMVYVVDSQHAISSVNSVTGRNTLFTGITRSRAWVRITGYGANMSKIAEEVTKVRQNGFRLEFQVPTMDEITELRRNSKDRSGEEAETLRKVTEGLQAFMDAYDRQEIDLLDIPPSLRARVITRLQEGSANDNI